MAKAAIDINRELIERCQQNDRLAQRELYERYERAMFNTIYRMVRNEEDARDVLQDAFVKAFRNLKQYRHETTFGGWLKRIVVNTTINHLKRKRLELVEQGDDVVKVTVDVSDDTALPGGLNISEAREAMLQLSTGYRTVLSLYLLEGYDHKEIAEILGVSVNTSLSQYSRGKKKLREILQKKLDRGRA